MFPLPLEGIRIADFERRERTMPLFGQSFQQILERIQGMGVTTRCAAAKSIGSSRMHALT